MHGSIVTIIVLGIAMAARTQDRPDFSGEWILNRPASPLRLGLLVGLGFGLSLRWFVNRVYLAGSPLKIGVASAIGAIMGAIGGSLALTFRRIAASV